MRVTASKVGLLAECQYFARPDAEWTDTAGPAAERGTRFHRAIAAYVTDGVVPEVADDIRAELAAAVAWVDHMGREKLAAEAAFAWDPVTDTAERLEGGERDYSAGKGRLCGTADLVAVSRHAKAGWIGDWKTGDASGAGPQLRALALMLARTEGLETVTVEALHVDATGVASFCRETLDAFALAAVAGELAEAVEAIPTAEPVPGPHCGEMYCPARATCPAGQQAIAQLVPADALVAHRMSTAITSPDHAAWMLDRVRLVEAACKAVKDAIKAAVPPEGWRLEDGSLLAESTREMPRFDKGRAMALLRELGASDEQVEALTYKYRESAGLRVMKADGGAKRKRRAA